MFTKRKHVNIFHDNHLLVVLIKNGIIQDICGEKNRLQNTCICFNLRFHNTHRDNYAHNTRHTLFADYKLTKGTYSIERLTYVRNNRH